MSYDSLLNSFEKDLIRARLLISKNENVGLSLNEAINYVVLHDIRQSSCVEDPNLIFNKEIDYLSISVRSANCLKAEDISRIGDLVALSPSKVMCIPNLGRLSIKDIEMALEEHSLKLGMDLSDWDPSRLNRKGGT